MRRTAFSFVVISSMFLTVSGGLKNDDSLGNKYIESGKEFVEVIPGIYENINDFLEGVALVRKDGKWGFCKVE